MTADREFRDCIQDLYYIRAYLESYLEDHPYSKIDELLRDVNVFILSSEGRLRCLST